MEEDDIKSRIVSLPLNVSTVSESTTTEKTTPFEFTLDATPGAGAFLFQEDISIIASSYQAHQLFSFGAQDNGKLSCYYSMFDRPMALALSPRKDCLEIWVGCNSHLIRCCAAPVEHNEASEKASGGGGNFTSTLVPRQLHAIGTHDIHGIYPFMPNAPLFLSTAFSALCQLDMTKPEDTAHVLWKPSFVSELRAEDRCHLNSICWVRTDANQMQAHYASCLSEADVYDGWREHRRSGGAIIDMRTQEVIVRELSMPHSLCWHKDKLWLLQSGTGELGYIDFETHTFVSKIFIPGFLRGLQFHGRFAIVGSSLSRHTARFHDLALENTLTKKKTSAVCGIFFIDMTSWTIVNRIEFQSGVREIYDILIVPGRRARITGINDNETKTWFKVTETAVTRQEQGDDAEETQQ